MLIAATSAFLLTYAHWHSLHSIFYVVALIPYYLYVRTAPLGRVLAAGNLTATLYSMLAYAFVGNAQLELLLAQFTLLSAALSLYGLAIYNARAVFTPIPLLLFFLWLPVEVILNHGDFYSALPQREAWQALFVVALLVLVNPLLITATCDITRFLLAGRGVSVTSRTTARPLLHSQWTIRFLHALPTLRSPPGVPFHVG